MFFSEEKNQKTFMSYASSGASLHGPAFVQAEKAKVFWFFSSEKNFFLPNQTPPA
jgi:hypothetical protein